MKKFSVFGIVLCVFSLLVVLGIPNVFGQQTKTYGYVIFRDAGNDAIKSDNGKQYVDCRIGGEDQVEIVTKAGDGSLVSVEFYPGKMYHIKGYSPSTRRMNLCFNVSGLTAPNGLAVRDILLKYKDTTENPPYVNRSNNLGWLDDGSVHAPILYNMSYFTTDRVQFAVDPLTNIGSPGTDLKAITPSKVTDYYTGDSDPEYYHPWDEGYPIVVYTIDYGARFNVQVVPPSGKNKKPITWIITPKTTPKLYTNINKDGMPGDQVDLFSYANSIPFAIAVSLKPFGTGNPNPFFVDQAPPKNSSVSATWGEIKGK